MHANRDHPEKQAVRQIRDGGRTLERIGRTPSTPEAKASAIAKEKQVYGTYRKLVQALAESADVEDRKLAVRVVARLEEDRQSARGDELDRGTQARPGRDAPDLGGDETQARAGRRRGSQEREP